MIAFLIYLIVFLIQVMYDIHNAQEVDKNDPNF